VKFILLFSLGNGIYELLLPLLMFFAGEKYRLRQEKGGEEFMESLPNEI
jgi:hypothetical protein